MSKDKELETFKIITLGNSGVGKTSIIRRFTIDSFVSNTTMTIGFEFLNKQVTLKNNKIIQLRIIDTGGQERFRSISKSYFKNADGVLFVFDLNNKDTFIEIKSWIELFKENHNGNEEIPQFLVGNKCDLVNKVKEDEIENFATDNNLKYKATSAKENILISELFQEIGEELYNDYVKSGKINRKQQNVIKIANNKEVKSSACCLLKPSIENR